MFASNYGVFSSQTKRPFIFKIITSEASFIIPIESTYGYNYNVDWIEVPAPGDPPIENPDSGSLIEQTSDATINFPEGKPANTYYLISIRGLFPTITFRYNGDSASKVTDILQWGDNVWQTMYRSFFDCSNLGVYTATDIPNLSQVTNMSAMFAGCSSFNSDISGWKTKSVTDMNGMFSGCAVFNQDLKNWNTQSVTDMSGMFYGASLFNANISEWNVGNVLYMDSMFYDAASFNKDLSSWCVVNIGSTPTDFDTFASSWVLARPVWGTCP